MAIATNPVKVNAANRAKATVTAIVTDPETNVNTVNAMIKKLNGKKIINYVNLLNKPNAKSMNYANKANTKKPQNCFAT